MLQTFATKSIALCVQRFVMASWFWPKMYTLQTQQKTEMHLHYSFNAIQGKVAQTRTLTMSTKMEMYWIFPITIITQEKRGTVPLAGHVVLSHFEASLQKVTWFEENTSIWNMKDYLRSNKVKKNVFPFKSLCGHLGEMKLWIQVCFHRIINQPDKVEGIQRYPL